MQKLRSPGSFSRRAISFVTAAILATVIAGCGGSKAPSQSGSGQPAASGTPVSITAWFPPIYPQNEFDKLAADFNAAHPNVHVNITVVPWSNGREKIKTALTSGQGPDVFYIQSGLDQDYLDAKVLAPVDSVGVTKDDLDKFLPLIKMNEDGGKLYALPLNYDVYMLYYRKDILKRFGYDKPPATWSEVYDMAKKISDGTKNGGKSGIMGFQFDGADDHLNAIGYTWMSMLAASGGSYITGGKSSEFSPAGVEALSYMRKFYADGVSVAGPDAVTGFANGQVAMFSFTQSVYDLNGWSKIAGLQGNWGMAPMPVGPKSSASYIGGHSVAVNAHSSHLKEAGEFMKWMADPQYATLHMIYGHSVPPFDLTKIDPKDKAAVEDRINADKANYDAIFAQLDAAVKGGSLDLVSQWRHAFTVRWTAEQSQLMAALTGQAPPESALTQIDARVNQELH